MLREGVLVDFSKKVDYLNPICPSCKERMNPKGKKAWCYNFGCDVLWRYTNRI